MLIIAFDAHFKLNHDYHYSLTFFEMKFSKVQISEVISKLNIGKVFPTNLRKFSKFFLLAKK
jgi:hypothetical protein